MERVESGDPAAYGAGDGLGCLAGEIRSNLNVILAAAELVSETPLTPEQLECFLLLREAGERLSGIMTDLLELSAMKSGRTAPVAVGFELARVLERVCELIARRATPFGVELSWAVAPGVPPWLVGDPGRLRRVLLRTLEQLVGGEGHGEIRVAVEPELGGSAGMLRITITGARKDARWGDTEPGWGPAHVSLANMTSRKLVGAMGGRMWMETGPSGETIIHFTVRCEPVRQSAAGCQPRSMSGVRVLLADASPSSRAVVRQMLKLECASVGQARSAAAIWAELQRGRARGLPYELLLVDAEISPEGIRGIVEQLQNEKWVEELAVVVTASDDVPEDRQWLAAAGINAYLLRPFSRSDLMEAAAQQISVLRGIKSLQFRRGAEPPDPLLPEDLPENPAKEMPEAIRVLISQFLEGQHAGAAALRNAGLKVDFAAVRRYAQGLSGTAERFGFDTLVTLGKRLESAAKKGNIRLIHRNVDAINAHLTEARSTLSRCA